MFPETRIILGYMFCYMLHDAEQGLVLMCTKGSILLVCWRILYAERSAYVAWWPVLYALLQELSLCCSYRCFQRRPTSQRMLLCQVCLSLLLIDANSVDALQQE